MRGLKSKLRRQARRAKVSERVVRALKEIKIFKPCSLVKGQLVNPNARWESGAVNLAYAGLWVDKEGKTHNNKRRSHIRESLNKQFYKPRKTDADITKITKSPKG